MTPPTWVADPRQVASVRRIVLDDGAERGVRALAFSTGGGLDFWVLADRSMDIGPLWWRGVQLGWQSPTGFSAPALLDADSDGGRGFERGFSGFLVTCGLTHIRQPVGGEPLHGRLPFTPARVTACGEDRQAGLLYAEGEIVQARYGGEALRLTRRIEAPIGGATLRIRDTVENLAADPAPFALLYHVNLGWPAVGPGTRVDLNGAALAGPLAPPEAAAVAARCWPSGPGPRAACIVETPADPGPALRQTFTYAADALPWLQLWRDLRPGAGVLSVEPCTTDAGTRTLEPGAILRLGFDYRAEGEALGV